MDMRQGSKHELERLWNYLTPLGEERIRMFVHLMQVNNRRRHIEQNYELVKRQIREKDYSLKPIENHRSVFNKVLEELKDSRKKQREELLKDITVPLEMFDNGLLRPSSLNTKDEWNKGFKIKYIQNEELPDPQLYSWGVKPFNKNKSDKFIWFDEVSLNGKEDYCYEPEMDVVSSLEFALDYILKRSKNTMHSCIFVTDRALPVPFCESIKAISSCLKKYDKELTDAYLRGARDVTKTKHYYKK